jgi:hypothetical protein
MFNRYVLVDPKITVSILQADVSESVFISMSLFIYALLSALQQSQCIESLPPH